MILIHRKLKSLWRLASQDPRRAVLTGVHVRQRDGRTRVEVTDGAVLVRVDAESTPSEDFPIIEGVGRTSEPEGIIPATAWREFFARAKFPRKATFAPILQRAGIVLQSGQATLVATDLQSSTVRHTPLLDAPYLNTDIAFPDTPPAFTYTVDAAALAKVLNAIVELAQDKYGRAKVTLTFYHPQKPMKIDAVDTEDHSVSALVAPLR